MPSRTYKGKVVCVSLTDLAYGGDFSSQLEKKDLKFYAECYGLGQQITFYVIGDDKKIQSVIQHAHRWYNTKFRRVIKSRSIDWKKFLGTLDEQWCDHVLTSCTLADFYDEVTIANARLPVEIPRCGGGIHAQAVPNDPEKTTMGGRFKPIVPYVVEPASYYKDYRSVPMINNEQRDTICLCKCI